MIQKSTKVSPWYLSGIAGLLASGTAIMVGEISAGLTNGAPTLIEGIGGAIIRSKLVPKWFRDFGIEQAGANQKPLLVLGIIVTTLLIGVVLGLVLGFLGNPKYGEKIKFAKKENIRNKLRLFIAGAVFIFFGIIGGLTLSDENTSSTAHATLTAFFAALLGFCVIILLIGLAENRIFLPFKSLAVKSPTSGRAGDLESSPRRNFLVGAGATAIFAGFGSLIGRSLLNIQRSENSRAEVAELFDTTDVATTTTLPQRTQNNFNNVDGLAKLITPNDDFYQIDTAILLPRINHENWKLKVTGMVDNELEIDFMELLGMGLEEETVTLSCVSNRVGGDLVGNAVWQGVPLKKILDMAGVNPNRANQIVGRSVDGWSGGFPTQLVYEPDRVSMVAVTMNGEPLPVIHGFPARLVVAGLYGYVSATKWLSEIELTTLDFDAYWITRGWSKNGPVKTQSRIDVPSGTISAGRRAVAGVAWAPDRGVQKVEVRIGAKSQGVGQAEWQTAELSSDVTDNAWRQWHYAWEAQPGEYEIQVRATDGDGELQTPHITPPHPNGATGWHTIEVSVI